MKKIILSLTIAMFGYCADAQTNTFPSSGNVGIGTTSPGSDLNVFETTDSKPSGIVAPTQSVLKLSRNGTPNYSYPESAEFRIGHGGTSYWGSKLDLFLNGASNANNIPDQQVMTWLYNGNVGIGTTTPGSDLTIARNGVGVSITTLGSGYFGCIALNRESATGAIFNSTGSAFQINNGNGSDKNLHVQVYSGTGSSVNPDALTINGTTSSVGINTTDTKGYQFAVNGSAVATSMTVKLNANWPDYVFKQEYKLPSLTEIKTYIDQNHHLPDMPSEQEVIKDGINLGDMNKLLTKKVEELTLYLFQQNKQLEAQQHEIEELKRLIKK